MRHYVLLCVTYVDGPMDTDVSQDWLFEAGQQFGEEL